jgi:hypothetical protein
MSVVGRGAVGAVVAGVVLLGGPAWAQQEDPCAPGPDGSVPEMCQSGPAQPTSDTGTVGVDPVDPCAGSRPVEPGDGVVTDGGDQGIAVGEPAPGTEPGQDVPAEPAAEGEPAGEPRPEPGPDAPMDDGPGAVGDEGIMCAFGVPVMAPGDEEPVLESATGGGVVTAGSQLPRTGPYDRLVALTAVGAGLVLAGAGAAAAGRRRA